MPLSDEIAERCRAAARLHLPTIERELSSEGRSARLSIDCRFKVSTGGEVEIKVLAHPILPARSMAALEAGFDGGRLVMQGALELETPERRAPAAETRPRRGRPRKRRDTEDDD